MGSLMAGWESHASDPNLVKFRRNKSLTNEDIEAYWKSKKQKEQDQHTSLLSPRTHHQKFIFEEADHVETSENGAASIAGKEEEVIESETSVDKIKRTDGWWVSSKWAFLNEDPVIAAGEGTTERYATHFHAAASTTSNGRKF